MPDGKILVHYLTNIEYPILSYPIRCLCIRPRASDEYVAESKPLASAPASLLLGVMQPDLVALDLTFKPTRGTVAALALPTNLPLDFVAGELCTLEKLSLAICV
jgi:hypothetical protein